VTRAERRLVAAVRAALTPDLLRPAFRGRPTNPTYGHCYHAAEALYALLGGRAAGYGVRRAVDAAGVPHYWVVTAAGAVLDPTAEQYTSEGRTPPYAAGKGVGFRRASNAARTLIARVRERDAKRC